MCVRAIESVQSDLSPPHKNANVSDGCIVWTRTGTTSRSRDFKGNKRVSNRREPRKRRRSGNASRRFARATDDSDPPTDDSADADKPSPAKDLRAPRNANKPIQMSSRMALVTRLLEEQLAAAKAGDEEAMRVLLEAVGRLMRG